MHSRYESACIIHIVLEGVHVPPVTFAAAHPLMVHCCNLG